MTNNLFDFERSQPSIEPNEIISPLINAKKAMDTFNKDINELKLLLNSDFENLELEHRLNYCLVMLCSAMDYYFHNIFKIAIIDMFNNKREEGFKFNEFSISIGTVKKILDYILDSDKTEKIDELLNEEISNINSRESFQSLKKLNNYVFPYIFCEKKTFKKMDLVKKLEHTIDVKSYSDIEKLHSEMIQKRNEIVHQFNRCRKFSDKKILSKEQFEKYYKYVAVMVEEFHDYFVNPKNNTN